MLQQSADRKQDEDAGGIADADDDPGDMVSAYVSMGTCRTERVGAPWLVLRLEHEWARGVADAVSAEHDRVRGHPLRVACRRLADPCERKDKATRIQSATSSDCSANKMTHPVVPTPVIHTLNSSPILSDHGRKLTRKTPMMFGMK
jgi:hypothetical protein